MDSTNLGFPFSEPQNSPCKMGKGPFHPMMKMEKYTLYLGLHVNITQLAIHTMKKKRSYFIMNLSSSHIATFSLNCFMWSSTLGKLTWNLFNTRWTSSSLCTTWNTYFYNSAGMKLVVTAPLLVMVHLNTQRIHYMNVLFVFTFNFLIFTTHYLS